MRHSRRSIALAVFAAALLCGLSRSVAHAQQYPTRPIHILVGFGPGSIADVVARVVGKRIAEKLGQPVVVEDRPATAA
jgi:tripartite-type tricarboxylate transporter receptor subunit TctC